MASALFGNAISVARARANRKQAEVARLVGIDASYLAGIETGRRKVPSAKLVNAILTTFKVSAKQRNRLTRFSVFDRLLDVLEAHSEEDKQTSAIRELLTRIAKLNDRQIDYLSEMAAVFEKQNVEDMEEL